MKALLINGSPREEGCTYTALCEVGRGLKDAGVDFEIVHVGNEPISPCINCEPVPDGTADLIARADEFDGLVVGSPVYYASASGYLTAFLDRLFYSGFGAKMADKPAASIASCRRGGASATFDQLNKYFTISNMPVVSSNYWNQVHGNTPDEVRKDTEGMQTMYILGQNMAWLIKSIDAGRKAGVPAPERPAKVKYNYVR